MQPCTVDCTNLALGSVQKVVIDWQLVKKFMSKTVENAQK